MKSFYVKRDRPNQIIKGIEDQVIQLCLQVFIVCRIELYSEVIAVRNGQNDFHVFLVFISKWKKKPGYCQHKCLEP